MVGVDDETSPDSPSSGPVLGSSDASSVANPEPLGNGNLEPMGPVSRLLGVKNDISSS
jgi:hypothetical protein